MTVMDHHDPDLLAELLHSVEEVARSGAFTGGVYVERFESAFRDWLETNHAVGVSSGTEALTLTLRAFDVQPGDDVIVPANSFVATAEAVCLAGANPVFADVDPQTQLITAETVQAARTPHVRGIIPVHLFGRTVAMDEIIDIARAWGVWVLEDCAQAHGARFAGRPVGTWGDAGTFSFYPAKNLGAWGDAGSVVTNRPEIAATVRLLRSHGEEPRYHHHIVGTTGRLDALQAAVLERKLRKIDGWNTLRRARAAELTAAISQSEFVQAPAVTDDQADHVFHQFVVCCPERDALREHLAANGIATGIHYPIPIHRSAAFTHSSSANDPAPVASWLASTICSLPIFPSISQNQVERIGDAVLSFRPAVARRAA